METSRSPLELFRRAYELGCRLWSDYDSPFSRHDFTRPQLFACLALRESLRLSYRKTEAFLIDVPDWLASIGMRHAPDHNTLWRAFGALLTPRAIKRALDLMAEDQADALSANLHVKPLLFESGAILLYLAEQHPALLPAEPQARWKAISWLFAGLNSVEPSCMRYFAYAVFNADKDWAAGAQEALLPLLRQKLKRVSDALGDNEWLAGEFSIADIMMVTVLNNLKDTGFVAEYPNLAAYHARGTERPAYKRALDAQLADFDGPAPQGRG